MLTGPKVRPPRLRHVVGRERLFHRLDDLMATGLVWVEGPAGSGKTTLLATYAEARGLPLVWYTLDALDDDPGTFFTYFPDAVARVAELSEDELPIFVPHVLGDFDRFARAWGQRLFDLLPSSCLIVLDDAQELAGGPIWERIVSVAMGQHEPGQAVAIASRDGPWPELARLRASGRLAWVPPALLRLDHEETRAVVDLATAAELAEADLTRLHELTAGWAAGLTLALERLRARGSLPRSSQQVADRELVNYVRHELLDTLGKDLREVLPELALLDPASVELIDAWTDRSGCVRELDAMAERGFLVTRPVDDARAFRLHPLLRAALLRHLEEELSAEAWRAINRRAAEELARRGRVEPALERAHEAQAWDLAARLILDHAPALLAQGRHATAAGWIVSLPEPILHDEPWLRYFLALGLGPAELPRSLELLGGCIDDLVECGDVEGAYRVWADRTLMTLMAADDARAREQLDRLVSMRDRLGPEPDELTELVAASHLPLAHWDTPGLPLVELFEPALRFIERPGPLSPRAFAGGWLLSICFLRGWLPRGRRVREAIDRIDVERAAPLFAGYLTFLEGAFAWLETNFDEALARIERGRALAERGGIHHWDAHHLGIIHHVLISRGELEAVGPVLDEMRRVAEGGTTEATGFYQQCAAWAALARGDWMQAKRAAERGLAIVETRIPIHRARMTFMIAQATFELGDADEARELLDDTWRLAAGHDPQTRLLATFLEADMRLRSGRSAVEMLRRGLAEGRERGLLNAANWTRPLAARALAEALWLGLETNYVETLITRHELDPPASTRDGSGPVPPSWPVPVRIHTFGGLRVERHGSPVDLGTKLTRPLLLLAALLARGASRVPIRLLADELWPEADGDVGQSRFDTTLYRLRSDVLGKEAITTELGTVSLDRRRVSVDIWGLEALEQAVASAAGGKLEPERATEIARRALELGSGAWLPGVADHWAIEARRRLERRRHELFEKLASLIAEASPHLFEALRRQIDLAGVDKAGFR